MLFFRRDLSHAKLLNREGLATADGVDLDEDFFNYVVEVASGKQTKNEENGYREISIFKDGVTL